MTFYTEGRIYSEAFDDGVDFAIQKMFGSGRIAKKKQNKHRQLSSRLRKLLKKLHLNKENKNMI